MRESRQLLMYLLHLGLTPRSGRISCVQANYLRDFTKRSITNAVLNALVSSYQINVLTP